MSCAAAIHHIRHRRGDQIHFWRTDEPGDKQIGWRMIEFQRRSDLLDLPAVEHDNAIGESHGLDLIMRHIDHRRFEIAVQFGDFETGLHAQCGIEVGERFVKQECLRLAHNGAADRDALALATGKIGRLAVKQRFKLQDFRGLSDPQVALFPRDAGEAKGRAPCFRQRSYADKARSFETPSQARAGQA